MTRLSIRELLTFDAAIGADFIGPTPTLIVHGDDDQIVPIGAAGLRSSKLVKNSILKVYAGAPHGLAYTHKDQLDADLLAFLKT